MAEAIGVVIERLMELHPRPVATTAATTSNVTIAPSTTSDQAEPNLPSNAQLLLNQLALNLLELTQSENLNPAKLAEVSLRGNGLASSRTMDGLRDEILATMLKLAPDAVKDYLLKDLLRSLTEKTQRDSIDESKSPIEYLLKHLTKSGESTTQLKSRLLEHASIVSRKSNLSELLSGELPLDPSKIRTKIIELANSVPSPLNLSEKKISTAINKDLNPQYLKESLTQILSNYISSHISTNRADRNESEISPAYKQVLRLLALLPALDDLAFDNLKESERHSNPQGGAINNPQIGKHLTSDNSQWLRFRPKDHGLSLLLADPLIAATLKLLEPALDAAPVPDTQLNREFKLFLRQLMISLPDTEPGVPRNEIAPKEQLIRLATRFIVEHGEQESSNVQQALVAEASLETLRLVSNSVSSNSSHNTPIQFTLPIMLPGLTSFATFKMWKSRGRETGFARKARSSYRLVVTLKHPTLGDLKGSLLVNSEEIIGELYYYSGRSEKELEKFISEISSQLRSCGFQRVSFTAYRVDPSEESLSSNLELG